MSPNHPGRRRTSNASAFAPRWTVAIAAALLLGAAPVSEKRIGLTRPHLSRGHLRLMGAEMWPSS